MANYNPQDYMNEDDFARFLSNLEKEQNELEENLTLSLTPLKLRKFFYFNEKLKQGEDLETEFKNYKLPLGTKSDEIKRQYCGFLNSTGGRLYLGINDEKIVKGNFLTYKQRDTLRNELVNLTYSFYPKCREKIKIHFIPIKNKNKNNNFIDNLYITKIIIYPGDNNVLYSISDKQYISYLRLQGQVANLTSEEICKEIIKRNNNNIFLNKVDPNEFNDPEPEVNLNASQSLSNLKDFDNADEFSDEMDDIVNKKKNNNKIGKHNKKKKKNLITLKISNLKKEHNEHRIESILQGINVHSIKINKDFGYVNFKNLQDAQLAESRLKEVDGNNNKKIKVNFKNVNEINK
jgi:hypothetical protein